MSSKGRGKRNGGTKFSSNKNSQVIPRAVGSEETPDLQFVNTISTTVIDESSKQVIRKHASRHRARPALSDTSTDTVNTAGQVHRFRLGPQGLKHTLNQPRQVGKNFTILSFDSNKQPLEVSAVTISQPPATFPGQVAFKASQGNFNREEDGDEILSYSVLTTAVSQHLIGSSESSELVGKATRQYQFWLESLLALRGVSLYSPSSSVMDPFDAMALTITRREQILVRYYFAGRREILSSLIPYCQVWFGLAIQDKAAFHAMLSHYSATHRLRFHDESPTESIHHLSTAIRIVTERLQDQRESCSNGTIGAVASLIIFESANGALPNIDFHMKGLKEMVKRRGGFEQADFPVDLKRLIAWTDLNTANDLWQPPHFPALKLPATATSALEADHILQQSSRSELESLQYTLSSSLKISSEPNIDVILENIKSFATELSIITRSISPLNLPRIEVSDRIHLIERQIFDMIHSPPVPQSTLDRACAIAALIYIRSNVRDTLCNFRIVKTNKLQGALQSLTELADLWTWGMEMRSQEKIVWTVGFGAVASAGRPERPWFVRLFTDICDTFELRSWESVKAVFESVLWKDELDNDGVMLWGEMQMTENN